MDIYVIIFFIYYLYLSFLYFFNYSISIVVTMNDNEYKFMSCWNLVITDSWAIDCKQKDTESEHLSALLNGNKLTFSFVLLTK